MKIGAINNYSLYSSKPQQVNRPKNVNFGILGTQADAEIAKKGGTPRHNPSPGIRSDINSTINYFVKELYKKNLYELSYITPIDTLADTPYFLFYRNNEGILSVEPVEPAFAKDCHPQVLKNLKAERETQEGSFLKTIATDMDLFKAFQYVEKMYYDKHYKKTGVEPEPELSEAARVALEEFKKALGL